MNAPEPLDEQGRLSAMLAAQRAAFVRAGAPTLQQRQADLLKLKHAVIARRAQLEAALHADFGGRSPYETTLMELVPIAQAINYQRRHLRRWMRPERRHVGLTFKPGRAHVQYQPLGVVGIISPWNFPVSLALMPLATAIAAGNRAMLKPSEYTPATSEALAMLIRESFDEAQVAVVTGGPEVGAAFAALPFDHLVFTGSTRIGRAVMKAASENLVPVTLELGGKSPAIVSRGYPIERAARDIAFGNLANGGQICITPDYALVHDRELEAFVAAYGEAVRRYYPAGAASSGYSSIINARHYARLQGLLEDARAKGARIVEIEPHAGAAVGGGGGTAAPLPPNALPPMVVLDVRDDMALMHEEIFGPVLPVVPYRTIEEAIAYVNARPRPLALYFFGDGQDRREVLQRTTSGNVTINDTLLHFMQEDLPFGGVGPSGMGAYHGIEGFKALSHAKGVFEQSRWNFTSLVRPPYGAIADLVIRFLLR